MAGIAAERAAALARAVDDLARSAERVDRRALYARPGAEDWSVMACLVHAAEFLPYWARQAREVASRERSGEPFGRTHDDPERVAAVERGRDDRLADVLPRLRAAAAEAVELLGAIPDERWSRSGRHARRGEMTVAEIVDRFLIEHVAEHARQARDAAAVRRA